MTEILHDSSKTKMTRDPQSGELVALSTDDCTLRFHRNGPLVRRHVVTSTIDGGLLAIFNYTHDVNLRLSSIEVSVCVYDDAKSRNIKERLQLIELLIPFADRTLE